jgi:putative hemolysin
MAELIDIRGLFREKNPRLARLLPTAFFRYMERIAHVKEVNEQILRTEGMDGPAFARASLDGLEIRVRLRSPERVPKSGPITVCANHPHGGVDGLALMHLVGAARGDFAVPANDLLGVLPSLRPHISPVNKHGSNFNHLRTFDALFASERPIIVFPAGVTARLRGTRLVEAPWSKAFLKKSKRYSRTIVPVFIAGRNSPFFYRLARARTALGVRANLEMLYLVDELYKLRGASVTVQVGKPFAAAELPPDASEAQWAERLRRHVVALEHCPDAAFPVGVPA